MKYVTFVRFQLFTAASMKFRDFWDEIALMMEAVRTSETSVHLNVTTRRYIPEDCKLHVVFVLNVVVPVKL
jgi:hypothetical protein